MYGIITQAVGGLGLIFGILAYQSNRHKKILLTKSASEFFFGIQYFMLGAYSGALVSVIGVIRNFTLSRSKLKGKKQLAATVFFLLLLAGACLLSWSGPISLLAILGKAFTTVSYSMKNTRYLRYFTIPSCIVWLTYNVLTHSIAGVVYEAFGMLSIIVACIRFDRKTAENSNEGEE